jgi:anti-repressor protein
LPAIRKHGGYLTDKKIEEALYNPDTLIKLATQLKEEREGRLIAEQQVAELKPKASYLDEILENKELITVSVIAKDYGMSAMEFNKLLHNLKVQFKQGKNWLLYSSYQSLGWTSSSTNQVTKKDGSTMNVMNTKWTQKGRLGLYELLKRHDILPMIERVE